MIGSVLSKQEHRTTQPPPHPRELDVSHSIKKRNQCNYTEHTVYQSALRLYELEEALRGLDFLRVGRSTILNFRRIRSIRPELGRRLLVTMDNGEQVWVSRQYSGELNEKLHELERSILK